MHLDVAFGTLFNLLTDPYLIGLMLIAVPLGAFFGAMPGLGGKLGVVLLIPFVFGMEPIAGAVLLLAMHSVVHTGGSIPSILFGIPGDGTSTAVVLDGYEMTRNGEGGRALGASFGASGIGGVLGAVFLGMLLPVLEPIVLAFSPAEFFLLAILGITFIATLSGKNVVKGLVLGLLGLMVAFVGLDPSTGGPRYTFGHLFLWDGIDIITAVLAMYAIPEMIALGSGQGAVDYGDGASKRYKISEVWDGIIDVFRHWKLTLRTSLIGAVIGLIPGLGGDAASWICYGHAVQSSKTPERFGKGAVEGVIAPETANNSKEGGALLPTLFFAVPGSSGMALLLGAFLMLGIQPGPTIVTENLDLVWTLIWALAVANVLCVVILVALTPWLGSLANVRPPLLIPFVLVFALLGSYLSSAAWENLILIFFLGCLGYMCRRHSWPRPPFVIGVVLGPVAEDSLHKALALWGPSFFLRPLSLILIAMIIGSIVFYVWRTRRENALEGIGHD
jgi:putative tricarboxylic transport membrane protein